ncbi:MAG: type IV pilus assembly protein PilM [candidate division WOR-3 bacterium]|jgi:type IV pilus assembly protein PilM
MAFKKRKKTYLGLDIGSSFIKYSIIDLSSGEPVLKDFGFSELSDIAIADGEIMDRLQLVDTVKNLLVSRDVKEKDVSCALIGRGVIVKKLKMDQMKDSELSIMVRQEAETNIPYSIEDVQLDYKVLGPSEEQGKVDVLLVAAKKEILYPFVTLIKDMELNPCVIDVPAFTIQNCFEANYDPVPNEIVTLVHIGYENTILSFIDGTNNLFTRDVTTAIKSLLQKIPGITKDQLDKVFKGETLNEISEDKIKEGLESFYDELCTHIERAIPFTNREKIDKIFISGGGANGPEILDYFKNRFEINVEKLDPFRKVKIKEGLLTLEEVEKISPLLVPSIGLSLRNP